MKVRLAKRAGFCMGVRRAMELALDAAHNYPDPIYTHGPLIHNPQVLRMLEKKGIAVLKPSEGKGPGTVVIRAHGIPPQEYQKLKEAGFTIVDATCPRVIKVQAIIKKYTQEGYTPIIIGDKDHPEVVGLLGYSQGKGIVLSRPEQVEALPELDRVIVVAQTTQDEALFQERIRELRDRFPACLVFNTICNATRERQTDVKELAQSVDGLVVVGGFNSGNTRRLLGIGQSVGTPSFQVETEEELDREKLSQYQVIGVTAGASTPNWMIRKVVQELESIQGQKESPASILIFRFLRLMLKSNLLVALGAGSLSLATCRLLRFPLSWMYFAITFLYIFSMHVLNHLLDAEAAQYNDPVRSEFYRRHKALFLFSGSGAAVLSLVLARFLGWRPFLFLALMSILGLLYSFQIVPAVLQRFTSLKKIKDIPASKSLSVALGWGSVTILTPALVEKEVFDLSTLLVLLVICSLVYIRSGLLDILDIQGDLIVGKETLPIIIGEDKALRLLKVLSLGTIAVLLAGTIVGWIPLFGFWLLIPFLYQLLSLILYEKRWALPESIYFEAMVESNFILAGILALAVPG